jgi:mono/diheme cytochrome c family protein
LPNRRLLLVVGAILAVGALVARYGFAPEAGPPAGSGTPLAEVSVPALSGAAKAGETAFNQYCATCHGKNAAGRDGAGPPLVHIVYEPNHHSDAAFLLAARRGVRAHHWSFGDMPPVEGVTDAEIGRIVAYVRTLQQANGIN